MNKRPGVVTLEDFQVWTGFDVWIGQPGSTSKFPKRKKKPINSSSHNVPGISDQWTLATLVEILGASTTLNIRS